jgi:hypothetical protein
MRRLDLLLEWAVNLHARGYPCHVGGRGRRLRKLLAKMVDLLKSQGQITGAGVNDQA